MGVPKAPKRRSAPTPRGAEPLSTERGRPLAPGGEIWGDMGWS